jgi:protocatechuate 3,4-dioxygenase beta subunit
MSQNQHSARRTFLKGVAALASLCGGVAERALAQGSLSPTPACDDDDEPTPPQTEGPFFSPNSPERSNFLEPGERGAPIVLAGTVLTRSCRPVAGALVELWHADDEGNYDNDGYRFRGHILTGEDGTYRFGTIVPGLYSGRTRHFHIKYQAPSQPVLTTQLYFPGEPVNARDRIFHPDLLLRIEAGSPLLARFDAVLDLA